MTGQGIDVRSLTESTLAFLGILTFGYVAAAQPDCLTYEPEQVNLEGVLTVQTFPGPPNYESTESGDQEERVAILVLDRSVCVTGDPDNELNQQSEAGVRRVQIVVEDWGKLENLIDQQVFVTGTLFHALTGHHHTPVLMTAEHVARATSVDGSELWKLSAGGRWKAEGQTGHYVVVAWRECSPEHCFTNAYLQRVIQSGDDGEFRSVESTPIREVNEAVGAFVQVVKYIRDDPEGEHFRLTVANTYDSTSRILRLWPGGQGDYRAAFE